MGDRAPMPHRNCAEPVGLCAGSATFAPINNIKK